MKLRKLIVMAAVLATFAAYAKCQDKPVSIAGAPCAAPPVLHCPDKNCSTETVINQGPVVEMKTRRTYFLDYPCDLKAGEKVTFILSLHGFGSYGNWQRHYFPVLDYVNKYRLVVATPNSPTHYWSDVDDPYLQNIVEFVVGQLGRGNIKALWLVGHSQGGMTSNRIIRTDFFKDRVDGWLSLSGGRLGGSPGRASNAGPLPQAGAAAAAAPPPGMASAMTALREPPAGNFSFIYETGAREMDEKGLPETSTWAGKLGCGARGKTQEFVDTKPGYVYDGTRQNPSNPPWGGLPAPGTAQVWEYSGCKDGMVVADIMRSDKGHTEGLEPKIAEELVKLLVSAKGGRISGATE